MKTPNDYTQVKFRTGAGSKLEKDLIARSSAQSNAAYSQTVKEDLSDYYTLLSLCLPEFSRTERTLLFQALHGWLALPSDVHRLWMEVEDALDSSLSPDNIDVSTFLVRLRGLSRFECWAIYDAIKRGAWGVSCPDL